MGQFILALLQSEEVMFLVVLVRLLVSLTAGKVLYGLYDLDPGSGLRSVSRIENNVSETK